MRVLGLSVFLLAGLGSAHASTTTLSIVMSSPASTAVTCSIGSYTAPLAAGSLVCPIVVSPAGWSGALALSGRMLGASICRGRT
jgi:hypothetical protein